jgi:hypothetical protein
MTKKCLPKRQDLKKKKHKISFFPDPQKEKPYFHAQGLVVAKLIQSLKPRLCTVLAALSICQVCLYQQI